MRRARRVYDAFRRWAILADRLGDVAVSLAPVVAGGLILATGRPVFDALVALLIGLWLLATTARELHRSADELIWPEGWLRADPSEGV